jgi:hypothetical protein
MDSRTEHQLLAASLARMATDFEGPELPRLIALRQLRGVARLGTGNSQVLEPLFVYASRNDGQLVDYEAVPAAWALAAGGEATEARALQKLEAALKRHGSEVPFLVLVLALAEHPEPSVTEGLARLAGSMEAGSIDRSLLALALLGRGDRPERWAGEVSSLFSRQGAEVGMGPLFDVVLFSAHHLPPNDSLRGALWRLVDQAPGQAEAVFPLLICASAGYGPVGSKGLSTTPRAALGGAAGEMVAAGIARLCLAAIGVEGERNLKEGLSLVGSGGSTTGDWYMVQVAADTLVQARLLDAVRKALRGRDPSARRGALRLAEALGPYGSELAPALRGLLADPAVGEDAKRILQGTEGFDEAGRWAAPGGTTAIP